jgi:hypothetical protein
MKRSFGNQAANVSKIDHGQRKQDCVLKCKQTYLERKNPEKKPVQNVADILRLSESRTREVPSYRIYNRPSSEKQSVITFAVDN